MMPFSTASGKRVKYHDFALIWPRHRPSAAHNHHRCPRSDLRCRSSPPNTGAEDRICGHRNFAILQSPPWPIHVIGHFLFFENGLGGIAILEMIDQIGPHIDRRGHPVRHIVKSSDGCHIPNISIRKTCIPQRLTIRLNNFGRGTRHLHRKSQHRLMARGKIRRTPIHHQQLAQNRISRQLPHCGAMRCQTIKTTIFRGHNHRDHFAFKLTQPRRGQHQIIVEHRKG